MHSRSGRVPIRRPLSAQRRGLRVPALVRQAAKRPQPAQLVARSEPQRRLGRRQAGASSIPPARRLSLEPAAPQVATRSLPHAEAHSPRPVRAVVPPPLLAAVVVPPPQRACVHSALPPW